MAAATRSKKGQSVTPAAKRDRAALPASEAAHYIGIAHNTLKKWRVTGDGPAYVRAGSRIVYLIEDLDSWLRANRVA
jgi:hypothetical protein